MLDCFELTHLSHNFVIADVELIQPYASRSLRQLPSSATTSQIVVVLRADSQRVIRAEEDSVPLALESLTLSADVRHNSHERIALLLL